MGKTLLKRLLQICIWLFPVWFLADDILGTNGYQFTIAGIGIRIVLFCVTCAILGCYCLFVLYKDKISLIPGRGKKPNLFDVLQPLDYVVLFFIFANFIWATVIPVLIRGEQIFALKDFSTILVLVLYFPLVFLIRTNRLNLRYLETIFYWLTVALAVWHCVMLLGDMAQPGFYQSYFTFIGEISKGTAVLTDVIYGYGIVRVIQTTSIFLLPGAFLAIRYVLRGKYIHLIPASIFVFGMCGTYTKSIWFGFALGIVVYLIPVFFLCKDKKVKARSVAVLLFTAVVVTALNYTVFDNTIFVRLVNNSRNAEDVAQLQSELLQMEAQLAQQSTTKPEAITESTEPSTQETEPPVDSLDQADIDRKMNEWKDAMGTQEANALRSTQIKALLAKWSDSKLLGFGYGSYTTEVIRHSVYPYMYEATLPALIMKIGILGGVVWLFFISATTVTACKGFWKKDRNDVFWWLGMAIAYGLSVQTNPLLFTFAGFSILLFLLVVIPKDINYDRH